jgi:hypothetical protein
MAQKPPQQGSTKDEVAVAKKSGARRGATYFAGFVVTAAVLEMLEPGWRNGVVKAVLIGLIAFFPQAIIEMILDRITGKGSKQPN